MPSDGNFPKFGVPQPLNIDMFFFFFRKQREGRGKKRMAKESAERGADPFLSHFILPFLDCSMKRTSILPILWGCGCTKHGKIHIQEGNLDPMFIMYFTEYTKHFNIFLNVYCFRDPINP
jgi:hypothetical protein